MRIEEQICGTKTQYLLYKEQTLIGSAVLENGHIPAFSIDPHMVQTPSGLYLFYCNNDEEAERPGTYILCDKMTDPYTLEGNPRKAVWATLDEEIYMRDRFKKGQHWHNSKWELFIVVAGHGLIQERNINSGETVEFEVSGDKIEAVHMIPGWTHNIINLSETENLVTVMTCNEIFNPERPDTFFEPV